MKYYKISDQDNVVVILEKMDADEKIESGAMTVVLKESIQPGHKAAIKDIPAGGTVIKYGVPIGKAKGPITAGQWVHSHNLETGLGEVNSYQYVPDQAALPPRAPRHFAGFRRGSGKVGVRNEIWIIPTVGCVNAIGQIVAREAQSFIKGSVEGIYSFSHPYGCSQLSQDHKNTQKALAGLINHPNAGAVLVLGLGCENNTIEQMKDTIGNYDKNRVKFLICQESADEIEDALTIIKSLVEFAAQAEREPCSTSELVIGLKCGASDGLSGITANPLVGRFSDMLVAEGGSTILTEVPEMFGAETLLMNRCKSEKEFDQTVALINNFKQYFMNYNQQIYENPSPGNIKGGITTLEEKSLGCIQKGGCAAVSGIMQYADPIQNRGLNLLQAPGNDLVASTALAVSGAHIVLFTTGSGTPFGCPVPTVKISSNSRLFEKKRNWIDFDAGRLLSGESMDHVSEEFFNFLLEIASGIQHTQAEKQGIREISIFKDGVTL